MSSGIHFEMTIPATMLLLPNRLERFKSQFWPATWRSGYAAVCKTVYAGSIPAVASILFFNDLLRIGALQQSSQLKFRGLAGDSHVGLAGE